MGKYAIILTWNGADTDIVPWASMFREAGFEVSIPVVMGEPADSVQPPPEEPPAT